MVTTSARPITVDGVRLDTLAWNITKIARNVAARRDADQVIPGRDGVAPSLNDDLEPSSMGLEMFVMGTDADGAVPGVGRGDTFRNNLDELIHLFGKRHALLDVQETVTAGVVRRAWAKVSDSIQPDVNAVGSSGQFTVGLSIPAGVWEDVATQDWAAALPLASGAVKDVTTLQGATERIQDGILLLKGPCNTGVTITDHNTGAYITLNRALSATEYWRVNVGTWATRYGTGLGLGSADTTGTDAQAITVFGGLPNQAAFLPLTPVRSGGVRKVQVRVNGAGFDATTALSIRARRKYAA